jgi:hypothetical protein
VNGRSHKHPVRDSRQTTVIDPGVATTLLAHQRRLHHCAFVGCISHKYLR